MLLDFYAHTSAHPCSSDSILGIRRIIATPLYFNAENWRLDMPEISIYPALIYLSPWISG